MAYPFLLWVRLDRDCELDKALLLWDWVSPFMFVDVRETSLRSAEVLHSSLARSGCFRSSRDAELESAELIEIGGKITEVNVQGMFKRVAPNADSLGARQVVNRSEI
jgi:hypothetical protein